MRPESEREAKRLTEAYASAEPKILQRDSYNSLPATFDVGEVRAQLALHGLSHRVRRFACGSVPSLNAPSGEGIRDDVFGYGVGVERVYAGGVEADR